MIERLIGTDGIKCMECDQVAWWIVQCEFSGKQRHLCQACRGGDSNFAKIPLAGQGSGGWLSSGVRNQTASNSWNPTGATALNRTGRRHHNG